MKIFNFKNPRHVQILKEELRRARYILREYNEAEIWKRLTVQQREELLSSVDDDMGPDFADEYAETDWLEIPDAVTNRIDISRYTADYAKSVDKDALMYARGILSIIYDTDRFKNTKQLQDFIAKEIGTKSTDQDSMKMALMQYARDNSVKLMSLNIKTQRMAEPAHGPKNPDTSIFKGATTPSTNPFNRGWTGD